MPTSLQMGDESAMNHEDLVVSLSAYLLFSAAFCALGVKNLHRPGPMGLTYG